MAAPTQTSASVDAPEPLTSPAPPWAGDTTVRGRAEGDAAAAVDSLGFQPYVSAVAAFLTSRETAVPLTMSVEGTWGSGKSSFMLQLANAITPPAAPGWYRLWRRRPADAGQAAPPLKSYIVQFNAWRYESDEAVWAAFALNFLKRLRRGLPWHRVARGNLALLWHRLDWDRGSWRILRTALLVALIAGAGLAAILDIVWHGQDRFTAILAHVPKWLAATGAALAAAAGASAAAAKSIGNPFERDIKRYFDAPDYRGKRAFVETFDDDFAKIVRSYVRRDRERVFVLIDDLDRCDVPRAAQLLQALNLLLSGPDLPIVYVLGLDREIVAASIASKLEKQVPYLFPALADPGEKNLAALDFAMEYVEKFVQVPFRIPVADAAAVERYIAGFSGDAAKHAPPTAQAAKDQAAQVAAADAAVIELLTDSPEVTELVALVAPLFDNNPRRIKQFVNLFRLQAYVMHVTGQFEEREPPSDTLTLPKLAKLVALILRYPRLASVVREKPKLLGELQAQASPKTSEPAGMGLKPRIDADVERYSRDDALMELLAYRANDADWTMETLNVRRILSTVPARTHALKRRADSTSAADAPESTGSQLDPEPDNLRQPARSGAR